MQTKKPKPQPEEKYVAFAVVQRGNLYFPLRLEVEDGEVVAESQIAPAGPYKPIAYQYLSGKVMEFYQTLQIIETKKKSP